MLKTILAAAAILATTTASAFAEEARTFTRGGETFTYTQVAKGDHVVIDGTVASSGAAFHLIVRGKVVTGTSNGAPVSFVAERPLAEIAPVAVASR